MGDAVGTESDEHHGKQEERQQALRQFAPGGVFAQPLAGQEHIGQQQQAVDRTPDDKSPVGTMPQTGERKHDHHVERRAPLAATRAAQGEIHIVAEPRHQ